MARIAQPKIESLGRKYNKNDVALFLLYLGRVGRELTKLGIDPTTVLYTPDCGITLDQNPNLKMSASDLEALLLRVQEWCNEKVSHLTRDRLYSSSLDWIVFPLTHFSQLTKYIQHTEYVTQHLSATIFRSTLSQSSLRLHVLGKAYPFETDDPEEILYVSGPIAFTDTPTEKYPLPRYGCSLSDYGKKALKAYLEEKREQVSSYEIDIKPAKLTLELTQEKQFKTEHRDIRRIRSRLESDLQDIYTDFSGQVAQLFVQYFIQQDILFNGIRLPESVKLILAEKLRPITVIKTLKGVSKIFQAMRDHPNNLDAIVAVLLTADDETQREAGIALFDIQKQEEEDDNEED